MNELYGCDDLRQWLTENGFTISHNIIHVSCECNWHAFKRSKLQARRCECNEDKKGVQIVVTPHTFTYRRYEQDGTYNNTRQESVKVDITGEAGGVWYELSAYGLTHDEAKNRLTEIETRLVYAWNALI